MQISLKILWGIEIVFGVFSLILFLLGATSNFQRSLDIVETYVLIFIWIPTLAIITLSIVLIVKKWAPTNGAAYLGLVFVLIILLFLSVLLFQNTNMQGLVKEKVISDSIKHTSDGGYEYRIELINLFQKNSSARLYLKNVKTGEVKNIPIEIQTADISGIGVKEVNNWIGLEPTDVSSQYILITTKELGIPEERFEVNIIKGTSKRIM